MAKGDRVAKGGVKPETRPRTRNPEKVRERGGRNEFIFTEAACICEASGWICVTRYRACSSRNRSPARCSISTRSCKLGRDVRPRSLARVISEAIRLGHEKCVRLRFSILMSLIKYGCV